MSMKQPHRGGDVLQVSELRMATLYGIEGLKRAKTGEHDEWLSLFDLVLNELQKPWNDGSGNFPLKEHVLPDETQRDDIIDKYQQLSKVAEKLRQMDTAEREQYPDKKLDEVISDAEELYTIFDNFEESPSGSLLTPR